MILFSQRDPRWGSLKLTPQSQTMAKIGCVVTSLAMISTYFKPDRTPADLLSKLQFTADGRILWGSVNFENWKFDWRAYARDDDAIKFHIENPDRAVFLNVENSSHWVVGVSIPMIGNNYKIADPWLGDYAKIDRYAGRISGAAYFTRK